MATVVQTIEPSSEIIQFGSVHAHDPKTDEPYGQLVFQGADSIDATGVGDNALVDFSLVLPPNYVYKANRLTVQIRQGATGNLNWHGTTCQVQLKTNPNEIGSDQQFPISHSETIENDQAVSTIQIRYFYVNLGQEEASLLVNSPPTPMGPDLRQHILYPQTVSFQLVQFSASVGPWVCRFYFEFDQYLVEQANWSPIYRRRPS